MLSEHKGLHCQHRSDDFPLLASIIARHKPATVVELGTDEGGFAAWLADTVEPWNGRVTTFDIARKYRDGLARHLKRNLRFVQADVLTKPHPDVLALISQPSVLLYCDNGHKMTEIRLYAPHLAVGSLLATHDYGTEVDAAWAEAFVAAHGYTPEGHDLMESLRNEWYPEPMTRFWVRKKVP